MYEADWKVQSEIVPCTSPATSRELFYNVCKPHLLRLAYRDKELLSVYVLSYVVVCNHGVLFCTSSIKPLEQLALVRALFMLLSSSGSLAVNMPLDKHHHRTIMKRYNVTFCSF